VTGSGERDISVLGGSGDLAGAAVLPATEEVVPGNMTADEDSCGGGDATVTALQPDDDVDDVDEPVCRAPAEECTDACRPNTTQTTHDPLYSFGNYVTSDKLL